MCKRLGWTWVAVALLCFAVRGDGDDEKDEIIVNDLRGFDDSILFNINWQETNELNPATEDEHLVVDAVQKNAYNCAIPRLESAEKESTSKEYTGRTPLDLITDLFTSAACSFRAESYWTYEVCHGDYIKQYHEEREGKTVKVQEYLLGKWSRKHTEALRERIASAERHNESVPHKKIEGLTLPYLELEMTDGTPCSLIDDKPRTARVQYVCYPHGKNEVYSLKEVSTCQYEVVILTQALCEHPTYKPVAAAEHVVRCAPVVAGSPVPPTAKWRSSLLTYKRRDFDSGYMKNYHMQKLMALNALNDMGYAFLESSAGKSTLLAEAIAGASLNRPTAPADTGPRSPFDDFISGAYCLTGGHGWWKYEFCFGRFVRQYHRNRNGEEHSLTLGKFFRPSHRAWLLGHEDKRPPADLQTNPELAAKTTLSYFYDEGSLCELTGKPRQTEVKLKCMPVPAGGTGTADQVQMYLLEPESCKYVLSVSSPLVCELMRMADEDGLPQVFSLQALKKKFGV